MGHGTRPFRGAWLSLAYVQNLTTLASANTEISFGTAKFQMRHMTLITPRLKVICLPYAALYIVYMCTMFKHSIFSRCKDMVSAYQNLNGSRDLTTTLSGMTCRPRLGLATINLFT